MPYSTQDDLLKEFSEEELARLTGDPDGLEINTERINYAREAAESLIDAYLAGTCAAGLNAQATILFRKLSLDLTVANLYEIARAGTSVPNTIVWRRINVIKLLKDIQSGLVRVPGYSPGTNSPPYIISVINRVQE